MELLVSQTDESGCTREAQAEYSNQHMDRITGAGQLVSTCKAEQQRGRLHTPHRPTETCASSKRFLQQTVLKVPYSRWCKPCNKSCLSALTDCAVLDRALSEKAYAVARGAKHANGFVACTCRKVCQV